MIHVVDRAGEEQGVEVRFGLLRDQFIASFSEELRIEISDLNGESDFVGHALAGAVSAGEKLKVLNPVILSVAVHVMDSLVGVQLSSNVLLHVVPVLENFDRSLVFVSPNRHSHVAVLGFARLRDAILKVVEHLRFLQRSSAFLAANGSGSVAPDVLSEDRTAAVFTYFDLSCSAPDSTAFGRAIHRVFSVFRMVTAQLAKIAFKRGAALLAGEFNWFDQFSRAVKHLTSTVTGGAAKFSSAIGLLIRCGERNAALKTIHRNCHARDLLDTIKMYLYQTSVASATENFAGVA